MPVRIIFYVFMYHASMSLIILLQVWYDLKIVISYDGILLKKSYDGMVRDVA